MMFWHLQTSAAYCRGASVLLPSSKYFFLCAFCDILKHLDLSTPKDIQLNMTVDIHGLR